MCYLAPLPATGQPPLPVTFLIDLIMRKLYLCCSVALLVASCQKKDSAAPAEAEDPDWIKLEVPTIWSSDETYSIAGDINKTLLVATKAQVNSTSDGGKTWHVAKVFNKALYGLLVRNDTLFALDSYKTTPRGKRTPRWRTSSAWILAEPGCTQLPVPTFTGFGPLPNPLGELVPPASPTAPRRIRFQLPTPLPD